ncbi:MAG: DNA translocase FtsK [Bacteroidia bacterium]|jgi:S-DNA-T family DNA segregation ATPase FtsK/SpoIIIE|nr:DNA translocase FtsK [Bacteroidia bacterium]
MKKAKQNKISTVEEGAVEIPDFEKEVEAPKPQPNSKGKLGFLLDERLHKIIGLGFTLFAIYLLIACVSFLATWQSDQSLVLNLGWDMFLQTDPDAAENLLGKIGAWVGYSFVYKGFGIASVLFSVCALAIGLRLLTQLEPIPIGKTIRYSVFGIVWLSLVFGFVFTDVWQILGGTFGHYGFLYLKGLIGTVGTGLLLISYALVFAVAVFNIKFYQPKPAPDPTQPVDETYNNNLPLPLTVDEAKAFENEPLNPDDFQLTIKPNEVVVDEEEKKTEVVDDESDFDPVQPESDDMPAFDEMEVDLPLPTTEIIPAIAEALPVMDALTMDSGLVLEVQETPEEEVVEENLAAEYGSLDSEYDPTLDYSNYQFPTLDLLNDYGGEGKSTVESAELQLKTKMIEDTLKNYNIGIKKISATIGPTVTLYEIVPQDGVRIAKIKNLEDDIALSLAALGIRIIAPIPGRGTIGIEVPNEKPAMVSMRSALSSARFQNADMDLPIAFGKNIQNEVFVADLAKMPHLLMAGATGQGKSVGLNAILVSLLYKKHPSQIKFVLVDPKKVELSIYKTIERHFLAKIPGDADAIITDTKLVVNTLNSLCVEMDSRYDLLKDAQVRNLKEYNAKFISRKLPPTEKMPHRFLPFIVVVIDEVADLMMTAGKEVEMPIARIAQLARAVGIHLILATQRPSVNVITGMIKANFPARVAFRVSQKTDSRTILDANGADQLIGKGDMLYTVGNDLVRLQCAFVDTPEVDKIANFIGAQPGKEPYILPEVKNEDGEGGGEDFDPRERDSLFEEAAGIIVQHQQGSTSLLQRKLNLGYNRAGRLIDQLERAGIVGPFKGSKAREVLISDVLQLEDKLAELRERG